jgi:hypothetical protein
VPGTQAVRFSVIFFFCIFAEVSQSVIFEYLRISSPLKLWGILPRIISNMCFRSLAVGGGISNSLYEG